jgi:aminopeptidase N
VLGRHYDEDLLSDYDVLDYDLDVNFWPERQWVDGRTTIRLKTTRSIASLTLRLAEALTVHSIASPDFGRLLFLRVVGQNSVIVNLPATVVTDTPVVLTIVYSGRRTSSARRSSWRHRGIGAPGLSRKRRRYRSSSRSPARSTATAATGTRNRPSTTMRPRRCA